jgi:hypothetical protein
MLVFVVQNKIEGKSCFLLLLLLLLLMMMLSPSVLW